jgi:DNA mismatch repair protein MutS2
MEAGRSWGRGIEWDAVRTLLAREARTAIGREQAISVEPLTDPAAIRAVLDETTQGRAALAEAGPPPLDTIPDVRAVLDRCRIAGSVLDGPDLVLLSSALGAVPALIAYGRAIQGLAPRIGPLFSALPALPTLREALRQALDDEGAVRDEASPHLRQLRRQIRERRRRIVSDLERLLQGAEAERLYTDRYVTVRHGRYVLPVRAEARARIRGIVHDRSQSGQTVFIEPAEAVEANNDLVQAEREEEQETARILAELTDAVRARLGDLDTLVAGVGAADWIFARAQLAERMGAVTPILDDRPAVALRGARHPLLLAQSWAHPDRPTVPVDLELTADRPVAVITGPNAGGKTIALKTLALHVLMTQTGCHLPADEGSRLPVFTGLHAIIGDDQSVAENLSTFSAFVKQIREILAEADERSLVLLDELGAGTDPDEGAALAQAILETLAERGALVLATTHLEPLKAFASTYPRARNASVEFDSTTLAPTFRLRYDRPGQSLALTIAARLGLAPELIARAEQHRSLHATRLSELLDRLDEFTRCEAERTIAIERRESEAAARLAAAREAEATAQTRARETLERARTEAASLLGDIRRAVGAEWDRLKHADRSRRTLDESRRHLAALTARVAPPAEADSPADAAALVPGAQVTAQHLGLQGELIEVAGASALVRTGTITVRVPLAALRPMPEQPAAKGRPASIPGASRRANVVLSERDAPGIDAGRAVAPELLLLGRRADEAREMVEKYLDDAFMAGLPTVRLVHGKGTGALRKAVRDLLSAHPLIESYRDGEPAEGGAGATVAAFKGNA